MFENVCECHSFFEAKEILAEKGIQFDRVITDDDVRRDWVTGETKVHDGVHIYFMVGPSDVAYYTPLMNTLYIESEPRLWHPDVLAKTHEYGRV